MKKLSSIITLLLVCTFCFAQQKPFTVPAIENWKPTTGTLRWNQLANISYNDEALLNEARYLSGFVGNIPAT